MPRLSTCFYFTDGVKDDGTPTIRNTDTNKNPIKTSSITYPPETKGEVVHYSEKEKGSGYYNNNGFHSVMYTPAPDTKNLMTGEPALFRGSVVIQATLTDEPSEEDWVTLNETFSMFDQDNYENILHNFLGNYVWIRAKVVISSGVLRQISLNY